MTYLKIKMINCMLFILLLEWRSRIRNYDEQNQNIVVIKKQIIRKEPENH